VSQTKREYWRKIIAEQVESRGPIRAFCRERKSSEHSFHWWRRRLREDRTVRFALLDTGSADFADVMPPLELLLRTGERLRIGSGVDTATLRAVLDAVRA
jgi:hypothetical protein